MYRLALIGAGQLGSRHLQALAKSDFSLEIEVVDKSEESLKTAKDRFSEITENRNVKKVDYYTSVTQIQPEIDLCIIATTSDIRARVTKELLHRASVRYILFEKVLFQSLAEYDEMEGLLKNKGVNAWVNCPRRIYPFYINLKEELANKNDLFFMVYGGEWGLACNAIHFIDLLAFLSGGLDYSIEKDGLDSSVIDSKREGYIELTGTLQGVFGNGCKFFLHSCRGSLAPHIIAISSRDSQIIVDEDRGNARLSRRTSNWIWEDLSFAVPFQSDLTHTVVENILLEGKCGLTPFIESAELHKTLLRKLLEYLRTMRGEEVTLCPIT
ncbi:MAG: Gfo/Idh/MocA family oxidoreductase [Spirochaetota bacterium]|nr:MAG: Gfo/Idh/MocA family oxidoreductase [Spirochaetota bacterium]